MIHVKKFDTAIDAHEGVTKSLFLGKQPYVDYDYVYGSETGLHDLCIEVDSFQWDFDIRRIWSHQSRWNTLVRQYINPEKLEYALDLAESRLGGKRSGSRGIVVMRTNEVAPRKAGNRVHRRWGSCMLALSYRTKPTPTVTLTSRTSYFGYLAALDINVAHVWGKLIGERVGVDVENMRFVWQLGLAQFHGARSIGWVLSQPKYHELLQQELPNRFDWSPKLAEGNRPGFRKALDGFDKIVGPDSRGKLYGDETYAATSRIRRRYHTEVMGLSYARQFEGGNTTKGSGARCRAFEPLPEVWCRDLDFSPIYRKGGAPAVYDEVEDDFDEDED